MECCANDAISDRSGMSSFLKRLRVHSVQASYAAQWFARHTGRDLEDPNYVSQSLQRSLRWLRLRSRWRRCPWHHPSHRRRPASHGASLTDVYAAIAIAVLIELRPWVKREPHLLAAVEPNWLSLSRSAKLTKDPFSVHQMMHICAPSVRGKKRCAHAMVCRREL